jgi:hypothetical protein
VPEIVLRHPKLPKQPIVLDVPTGAKISRAYSDAGWEIDNDTLPDDAREETPRAKKDKEFVAAFETDADEAEIVEPTLDAPVLPAEPDPADQPTNPTEGN